MILRVSNDFFILIFTFITIQTSLFLLSIEYFIDDSLEKKHS